MHRKFHICLHRNRQHHNRLPRNKGIYLRWWFMLMGIVRRLGWRLQEEDLLR
jgi:hypothetical protein